MTTTPIAYRRDPRTHVLALIDHWSGGAEHFARYTIRALDPARYRKTLCVTRAPNDPNDEARGRAELAADDVALLTLGRRHTGDVHAWLPLVRYLRTAPVDILHAHKFGSNVWASLLRTPGRVPVCVAHEHTWSYQGQPLRRNLDRHLIARRCDRMIAVSRADRQRMIDVEGIHPGKIAIIPIGIRSAAPSDHDVRAELGLDGDDPIVVCVGYLRAQKAHEVLVEAAAQLRRTHPSVRVLIVGDGPQRGLLERMIAAGDLADTVRLLGRRRDVVDIVAAARVGVCCSDFEGSPLAVIEYMAAGKPVVATRVGGLPDLVQDGRTGVLVAPRSPVELSEAVRRLLDQPERADAMGRAGQERQRRELTLDSSLERLEALYGELMADATERGAWQR